MGFRRVNLGWLLQFQEALQSVTVHRHRSQHASFLFSVFPDYLIDIGLDPPQLPRICKEQNKKPCLRSQDDAVCSDCLSLI